MSVTSFSQVSMGILMGEGKADYMGCTDLETLQFAEKIALKKAVQYANQCFDAELIDGDFEMSHRKFQRAERTAGDIAHHIDRVKDKA